MKYNKWELLEELPEGWKIDKTVGTPLNGYIFITNGKSVVNGQKRALLKVEKILKNQDIKKENINICLKIDKKNSKHKVIDLKTAFTANQLARKKFEEKLLQDIKVDLMICEIEGWNKLEYIEELKKLINSIGKQEQNIVK